MKEGQSEMRRFNESGAEKTVKVAGSFHLKTALGLILVTVLVIGCGGGGGGSSSAALSEGTFVDSPVEGLEYETETQSGVTDVDGTFMYMDGETVTFYVGDVVLGEAPAQSVMTPVDLVDGATDETHPMVTNMARFLQTLDADMDPENGITITAAMADAMVGHMIEFNMDPGVFEHDSNVQMFMDTLNMMDPSGPMWMMVSIEDAQNHLGNTMTNRMSGDSGMMDGDTGMVPGGTDMMGDDTDMMSSGNGMMN